MRNRGNFVWVLIFILVFWLGSMLFARWACADGLDSYVELLLHADNAGNSNFVDSSFGSRTVNAVGVAGSSFNKVFGAASALSDGSGDYLYIPVSSLTALGTLFTIDLWAYFNDTGQGLFCSERSTGNDQWVYYFNGADNTVYFQQNQSGSTTINVGFSWTPSTGGWYHLELVCDNGYYYFFVNGTQQGSTQYDATGVAEVGTYLDLFENGSISGFNGYVDEFRLSIGVARHTSNFTAPSAAYSEVVPTPTPSPSPSPTVTPCEVLESTDEQSYKMLMALSGICCGVITGFGLILAFKRV